MLQSDVYAGYNGLYLLDRDPGPVICTFCWSHSRRKFFELADIRRNVRKNKPAHDISPIALEAVQKIDAIFDIERELNGLSAPDRHAARQELVRPPVENLHTWLIQERARMSKHNPVAKAINYMIQKAGRWEAFTAFLDDGQICLTNNAAERALRGVAPGRKSRLFAGSERGGDRAAFMYTLIVTAKMNDIDPQAWLADVLKRLPDMPSRACTSSCRGTGKPQRQSSTPHSRRQRRMFTADPRPGKNGVAPANRTGPVKPDCLIDAAICRT